MSGSTCTAAILFRGVVLFVNLGDSRAVLCRDGSPVFTTTDHKPSRLEEYNRIHAAGGFVLSARVDGALAVSRAFGAAPYPARPCARGGGQPATGDARYKQAHHLPPDKQRVVAVPDIAALELQPADDFLLLACDGLWDVMTARQAVLRVTELLDEPGCGRSAADAERVADALTADAIRLGSKDNVSVLLWLFRIEASGGDVVPSDRVFRLSGTP